MIREPDRHAQRFQALDAMHPGPRGPLFERYWSAFLASLAAREAYEGYHGHDLEPGQSLAEHRALHCEEDCPGYSGANARVHDERQRLRNLASDAEGELWIAARLWESRNAPAESRFYVTALRGEDVALLAGPYDDHETALRLVPRVKLEAQKVDPRAWTYRIGTSSLVPGPDDKGALNELLARPEPIDTPAPAKGRRRRSTTVKDYQHP